MQNIGDMEHRKLLKNIGHRTKEETMEIIVKIDMKQEEMVEIICVETHKRKNQIGMKYKWEM